MPYDEESLNWIGEQRMDKKYSLSRYEAQALEHNANDLFQEGLIDYTEYKRIFDNINERMGAK